MPDPSPSSSSNFVCCWGLFCSCPQIVVADLVRPVDFQDSSETFVYEGLHFIYCDLIDSPCLCPIEQDGFYVGVKDSDCNSLILMKLVHSHSHKCNGTRVVLPSINSINFETR